MRIASVYLLILSRVVKNKELVIKKVSFDIFCDTHACHFERESAQIPLRLRLVLFRPCHLERSRNPSNARIKRHKVAFEISDEKVRQAQDDTLVSVADEVEIRL